MRKALLILFSALGFSIFGQTGNSVFNDTILHTLYIETDLPDWFATLEQDFDNNFNHPDLYPEIYHYCKVTFDGITLDSCGFREKGNASNTLTNYGKKKPLKISFDEFRDQTLDGLKKINLNNFTNDPSLLHDVLSFKLFRDAGLVASRTTYTKVYVNNEYLGLYVGIENVDKVFLRDHYGSGVNNDGNLYKTDRGAAVFLNWLGTDKASYKDVGFKLTTNESTDDWTRMIYFIDFINHCYDADFKQRFEALFDVHSYLKILAIEKCIRSWDSYWGGGNNFFIYEHPDGQMRWIPWDMNETFQDIKIIGGATSLLDGYLVPTNKFDQRPLLKRIFDIPEYKTEYLNYVCDLTHHLFTLDHLGQFALDRHNLIDDAYKTDPNKYNSYESFRDALTDYNQDAVSLTHSGYVLRINYPGIYPFIQSQREWAVEQINAWGLTECSIEENGLYDLFVFPNPTDNYINVSNNETGFEFAQFRLYDYTGKLCFETDYEVMSGNSTRVELTGIPPGFYMMMKYSADGKVGRAKIIVK